jgi:hypothetical protein
VKTKIHIARNILDELNEKYPNERIGGTNIYHCSLHMELPLCLSTAPLGHMGREVVSHAFLNSATGVVTTTTTTTTTNNNNNNNNNSNAR